MTKDLLKRARLLRQYVEENAKSLSDEAALDLPEAFPLWITGTAYAAGDRVRYEEKLYKCVQAHTSQADWHPDVVPALWTEVAKPGEIPEWKQPTGAHDAYHNGDLVTHNGIIWRSTVDSNVWEPGVYGWEEVVK